MNNVLMIVVGFLVIIVGMSLFVNLKKATKRLGSINEQRKKRYDVSNSRSSMYKKVLRFLLLNQNVRYYNENNTRYGLLFLSLLLVIWGISLFLLGMGLVN